MPNKLFIPILLTVFIDMIGVGIVVPVYAPLFLNESSSIFNSQLSFNIRSLFLGIVISAYPFSQFFGAPILGQYSDKYGRKPLLFISLLGTLAGYILAIISILTGNIIILFIGRMIDGFTGGNVSIAMSAIADVSDGESKAQNFALIGTIFGLGLILGPFLGGILSDSHYGSWFNYATPFVFAALITLINIIALKLLFVETLKDKIHQKVVFITGIINIKKAFRKENMRILFLVSFLVVLGFNFFTQFFQVYLIEKFNLSQSQIGYVFGYVGIWIIITQGVIIRKVMHKRTSTQILSFSIIGLALIFPILLLPNRIQVLFLVLPLISIFSGLTLPNISALISNNAKSTEQGEILGINQSLNALGSALPPLISGILVAFSTRGPTIAAAIFILLAWIIFKKYSSNKNYF